MSADDNIKYMRRAIELARKGWGTTHPNPMVGSVIVDNDNIVAEGFHRRAGTNHAEVEAISKLDNDISSDTVLYVTLEPCSTMGRTGACTDVIINSKIKNVVIGATDSNPLHSSKGIEILKKNGINVINNILAEECSDLNLLFNHWIKNSSPFLAAKVATTLDGKIATRAKQSKWITGEKARTDVMKWRRLFPAIAVGSQTVIADNPSLTSRLGDDIWCPKRFIFDRKLSTVNDKLYNVYSDEFKKNTTVVTSVNSNLIKKNKLAELDIEFWEIDTSKDLEFFNLFCEKSSEQNIVGILFEGGATLLSALLQNKKLDYLFNYRAPVILADDQALTPFSGMSPLNMDQAIRLNNLMYDKFDQDQLLRGAVIYS